MLLHTDPAYGPTGAGLTGALHYEEAADRLNQDFLWTRYSDGRSFEVPDARTFNGGSNGEDAQVWLQDGTVHIRDAATGTQQTVAIPPDAVYNATYGTTVVAYATAPNAEGQERIVRTDYLRPDGDNVSLPLAAPDGSKQGLPVAADARHFATRITHQDGTARWRLLDRETLEPAGETAPVPSDYSRVAMGSSYIAFFKKERSRTVLVVPRNDIGAQPVEVTLETGLDTYMPQGLSVVGDWLVYVTVYNVVMAAPINGGEPVQLLFDSMDDLSRTSDGAAVVTGGRRPGDWAIRRITGGTDGPPTVSVVKQLPVWPVRVNGLSLAHGRLHYAEGTPAYTRTEWTRTLSVGPGTPTYSDASKVTRYLGLGPCPAADTACAQLHLTGDGRSVAVSPPSTMEIADRSSNYERVTVPAGAQITDALGNYVLYTDPATNRQTVHQIGKGKLFDRAATAAALWDHDVWVPGSQPGTVAQLRATDGTKRTETAIGAPCVPAELQVNAHWIYYACPDAGPAGVYDRTTKATVSVPSGDALLGDGYLVTHDKAAGHLRLRNLTDGTTRTIGDLPDTGRTQRHIRWTVDRFGGSVAYVDEAERIHVVPTGVTASPVAAVQVTGSEDLVLGKDMATLPGHFNAILTKPVSSWTFSVVRGGEDTAVYTRTGGEARGRLRVDWNGKDSGGKYMRDGVYIWTLTATPADGRGAPLTDDGGIILKGNSHRREHIWPAGTTRTNAPDMLTLNTRGEFTFHRGTGTGGYATTGKVSGGGWPQTAKAVPFGDLNGDTCNDVLVQIGDELRAYRPACGGALASTTPYTKLSTGWSKYNLLTSPGDMTNDGRPDLLARESATGDIYLFAGADGGKLAARTKIRTGWAAYNLISGAGDLNGDGFGDLLTRHTDGTLYWYAGLGTGQFKERVKIFSGWGGSYTSLVGAGDITGDGKADMVVRDKNGVLYRNNGDGKGGFSSKTQLATGWTYVGLF
ncbi:FG-GAP repeat domain-containing protein [Streptomyces smaragdinus]|uniref:FG-GAP repeat domain-containing protein n=1 Tax=Streptomyces smaragdinus TaxID=2585196 RepID=UPI0012975316|nr:VCBS repeat-containing protein [Streptomyces smaragdinus]